MEMSDRIGRRMKLHDIHVLIAVVQAGSMRKAAALLNTTQSAISRSIAELEHTTGVRLLDRISQGVEPTQYGRALLKRGVAAFDELKQGVHDIEYLADPTTGEVRIACPLAIAFTVIPHVIEQFSKKYPRAVLHFDEVATAIASRTFAELRDRKYDLVLTRGRSPEAEEQLAEDFKVEFLFDEQLVIAAGAQSRWAACRRKIDFAELVDEPWIMQAPHTWNYQRLAEAFHARGVAMPRASLVTLSMPVITHFLANGPSLTAMPRSVAYFCSLKVLPVDLPARPWPVNIVTLKNRMLSPMVERFIDCAREVTKSMAGRPARHLAQRRKPNVS
jgi:DNA-binding transcriptional LysR family regulator